MEVSEHRIICPAERADAKSLDLEMDVRYGVSQGWSLESYKFVAIFKRISLVREGRGELNADPAWKWFLFLQATSSTKHCDTTERLEQCMPGGLKTAPYAGGE